MYIDFVGGTIKDTFREVVFKRRIERLQERVKKEECRVEI